MTDLDQLVQPLAGSDPCGADLEYDSRFLSIKEMVEGGTEENPAEWKKVKKLCLELLSDGRSTELIVYLVAALVATEGYQGLRDGFHVLAKSMEEFWDTIYPKLDESEPEDERYDYRLNALAQLGEPVRKMGDPIGFLEHILRSPLVPTGGKSGATYWPVWEKDAGGENADPGEAASALESLSRMAEEDRSAFETLIAETIESIESLGSFLMEKTGAAYNAPFDEHLLPALKKIHNAVASAGSGESATTAESEAVSTLNVENENSPAPASKTAAAPGTINSTADVRKALDRIISYYRKAEPSSPVPYLLKRAEKLIDADFIEIVKNLNADSEYQFRTTLDITGSD
jgi:type VI secretion system protein ImpA